MLQKQVADMHEQHAQEMRQVQQQHAEELMRTGKKQMEELRKLQTEHAEHFRTELARERTEKKSQHQAAILQQQQMHRMVTELQDQIRSVHLGKGSLCSSSAHDNAAVRANMKQMEDELMMMKQMAANGPAQEPSSPLGGTIAPSVVPEPAI